MGFTFRLLISEYMKKILLYSGLILWLANTFAQQNAKPLSDETIRQNVKALLAKMTIEEKAGQMTQLSVDMISVGEPYNLVEPQRIDSAKLKKVIVDYGVGSILNASGHAYTREYWAQILNAIHGSAAKTRLKIPVLYGIDAIHGPNYTVGSTLFPQQIALAASWNPALAKQMGQISAYETRASGIPWTFSPVMDIARTPLWPRVWETFGEDAYLASQMGASLVKGYEGDNNDISNPEHVAACLKHFVGYGMPLSGKDRSPAWVPERQLREYFLPPFQAAIDAGAHTIMINSGEMNGIPVHTDPNILTKLLRDEMGFKGIAVTDWEDIGYLVSRHKVAKDYREAVKMAINAGVDMAMVPMELTFTEALIDLVKKGEVPMARVDEAVSRILTVKYKLGLFDKPMYEGSRYPKFASAEHVQASLESAHEVIALLKNEKNALPLAKTARVLVTGPTANSLNALNGGWTHTWQGAETKFNPTGKLTVWQSIQAEIGDKATFVEGASIDKLTDVQAAVAAAQSADAVVLCLGEMPYTEKPGDIDNLDLPEAQLALAKALAATGKPIILVLLEGRPRVVRDIEPLTAAVLMGFLPGNEGGRAIADVLFGDVNPSGKLPYTYPRNANDLVPYDHKGTDLVYRDFSTNGFKPQWEFGAGLSYTTFAYSNLTLSKNTLKSGETLTVKVTVTNTGSRAGKEVVQLYTSDKVATITPSVKKLRRFEKVLLQPNESKTLTFTLTAKDLAFVGRDNKWITEPGAFDVLVGSLKAEFVYE